MPPSVAPQDDANMMQAGKYWLQIQLGRPRRASYAPTMNDADIKPMADAIFADKVRRARAAPASRKMGWGPELFAEACVRMKDGIRHQFPNATETEVGAMLLQRLKRLRQVAEHGIYQRKPA
jgi:hypothetical protein